MGRTEEAQQEDGAGIAGKETALEPTINVLGVREDGAWCAIALEMSLRGYGRTFEAALDALRETIEAQVSFLPYSRTVSIKSSCPPSPCARTRRSIRLSRPAPIPGVRCDCGSKWLHTHCLTPRPPSTVRATARASCTLEV